MRLSKIKIRKIIPKDGLVGFASCVIDDALYIGNIAIFSRLNEDNKYRLVFPVKEVENNKISIIHPLTQELYYLLEKEITDVYKQND
jgi:DNA-binding cell septation regulator SpoVG